MKTLGLLMVLALSLSAHGSAADMRSVRIETDSAEMRGLRMLVDGEFAGVVGDTVMLKPFSTTLSIEMPWGLQVSYLLETRGGVLTATEMPGGMCMGTTAWRIQQPATYVAQEGPEASLSIRAPRVMYEGICPVELPNLSCLEAATDVRIDSVPEVGAEIWVDGVSLAATTARDLNVGYCAGTSPWLSVLLRKPGYISCQVRVELDDRTRSQHASCTLGKL